MGFRKNDFVVRNIPYKTYACPMLVRDGLNMKPIFAFGFKSLRSFLWNYVGNSQCFFPAGGFAGELY